MKYTLLFLLSFYFGFSQCDDVDKLQAGGSHLSISNNYIPFTYIPENASDSISYGIDINKIKKYADFVIDKSKKYIIKRAGQNFYDKLEFDQVEINYKDVAKGRYEDESLYELKNFDYTYWMLYTYRNNDIEYVFGLEFNRYGDMVSENQFPDTSNNKDFQDFVPICDALNFLKLQNEFKGKKVDFIKLAYLDEINSFCWFIQENKPMPKALGVWEKYTVNQYFIDVTNNKLVAIKQETGTSIACGVTRRLNKD